MLRSWLATIGAVAILVAGAAHVAVAQDKGKPAAASRDKLVTNERWSSRACLY